MPLADGNNTSIDLYGIYKIELKKSSIGVTLEPYEISGAIFAIKLVIILLLIKKARQYVMVGDA